MKGWKTFIFFTLTGIAGLIAALQAIDVQAFLLPLVCHVDVAANVTDDVKECVDKIIKIAGYWTAGLSAVGLFLRTITTSPIFKTLLGGE